MTKIAFFIFPQIITKIVMVANLYSKHNIMFHLHFKENIIFLENIPNTKWSNIVTIRILEIFHIQMNIGICDHLKNFTISQFSL